MARKTKTDRGRKRPSAEIAPAKQARGSETREKLLEAAIACFDRHGVAATNTTMISDEAGLTRGAYLHHFKSREMLIAAAIDHMQQALMGSIEDSIRQLFRAPGEDDALFVAIWKSAMSDGFFAGYEMMLNARQNEKLRREWLYHSKAFRKKRQDVLRALFPEEIALGEAYYFVEGLADFYRGLKIMEVVRSEAETRAVIAAMAPVFRARLAALRQKLLKD